MKHELTRALLDRHWKQLVKDNANIDLQELDARLQPISYLRKKLKEKPRPRHHKNGQLNLFDDEP